MQRSDLRPSVPILRVFKARARPGCEATLAERLADTSGPLFRGKPGVLSFLTSVPASAAQRDFIFATIWSDADALQNFYGRDCASRCCRRAMPS